MNRVRLNLRLVLHQSINDIDGFPDATCDEVAKQEDVQVAHMMVGDASEPAVADVFLREQVLFRQIVLCPVSGCPLSCSPAPWERTPIEAVDEDRKSTRLNSSHANISYAVFCLKKKK